LWQIEIDLMTLILKPQLGASISTSTSDNFLIRKLEIWGPGVELGQSWGRLEVQAEGHVAQL
jgi:hypothetical protein